MSRVTLDRKSRLYVIPANGGYSCLGFDVLNERAAPLAAELGRPWPFKRPSVQAYAAYDALLGEARRRFDESGWRSATGLTPQLLGMEGSRVEVVDRHGERRRFWVGRSTGWVPCHLEIARVNCYGGGPVYGAPFRSVRVIRTGR